MIEITSHKVNGLNEALKVMAKDEPGQGGAHHRYVIEWQACAVEGPAMDPHWNPVVFQNGPIKEAGVNGISNEALLAIVEHRLQCFQAGPFACRENAVALTKIQEAMHWLHHRTRERVQRGVEGTNVK